MPKRVDIKICGLTNLDDAKVALDCGADFLGFVLYPKSPRCVDPAALRRMLDALPGSPRIVAVFVNERRPLIQKIAADCGLYAARYALRRLRTASTPIKPPTRMASVAGSGIVVTCAPTMFASSWSM